MAAYFVKSVLCIFIFSTVDCQITSSPSSSHACVGDNVTLGWVYGDAANFASVIWKHIDSSSVATTIMQFIIGDTTASAVGGYNVVHNGNGKITLTEVNKSNSGSYSITVSYTSATPSDTDTVKVVVDDCSEPFPWWYILIGIGGLYLCGIVIGIFMYCCNDEPWNKINVGDKTYWWIFLLIIVIAGLGILTVYLICKGCGRFNAKNESEPDSMQEKMKMAEDLASHDQDKNAL